jgi:hypothetical protein
MTELGPAYVKASRLNEAIKEALAEEADCSGTTEEPRKSRFPEIADIDIYSEALQCE